MKKILSLTLMLVTALAINAQINTNIWGLTVGKSTKQQVQNILKKKGYNFEYINNVIGIEPKNGINFGGIHWTAMTFDFYGNTLYDITFLCYNETNSTIYQNYDILKSKLINKYSKYYTYSNTDDTFIFFNDGKTTVYISTYNTQLTSGYEIGLSLHYTNNHLENLIKQSEDDEL